MHVELQILTNSTSVMGSKSVKIQVMNCGQCHVRLQAPVPNLIDHCVGTVTSLQPRKA